MDNITVASEHVLEDKDILIPVGLCLREWAKVVNANADKGGVRHCWIQHSGVCATGFEGLADGTVLSVEACVDLDCGPPILGYDVVKGFGGAKVAAQRDIVGQKE